MYRTASYCFVDIKTAASSGVNNWPAAMQINLMFVVLLEYALPIRYTGSSFLGLFGGKHLP